MISFLRGTLVESLPHAVVIDVRDVGYHVRIPASTFARLPAPPSEVLLHTVLQVREDEHVRYGFATRQERDLYRLLVSHVSGVGPKLALAVLGGCSPDQFQNAVAARDTAFLSAIKGLGKKTAERIVVELKDKLGIPDQWAGAAPPAGPEGQLRSDALLALISLGYKQPDALKALETAGPQPDAPTLIRAALQQLNS
jgi:holliday junction DNA helicase RuvA